MILAAATAVMLEGEVWLAQGRRTRREPDETVQEAPREEAPPEGAPVGEAPPAEEAPAEEERPAQEPEAPREEGPSDAPKETPVAEAPEETVEEPLDDPGAEEEPAAEEPDIAEAPAAPADKGGARPAPEPAEAPEEAPAQGGDMSPRVAAVPTGGEITRTNGSPDAVPDLSGTGQVDKGAAPAPEAPAEEVEEEAGEEIEEEASFVPEEPTGRFTTAQEVRPILDATRASWVAVRRFGGQDLLYFTHLESWRCGLGEIRYGVNGGSLEVWEVDPCFLDSARPNAIGEGRLPYTALPLDSVESVTVEITYDDGGTDAQSYARREISID